jgi:hypothetical protein
LKLAYSSGRTYTSAITVLGSAPPQHVAFNFKQLIFSSQRDPITTEGCNLKAALTKNKKEKA